MERLPPPSKLSFANKTGSVLADDWRKWKDEFKLYCDLALAEVDDEAKIKMFKYLIGPEGREIYETQRWTDDESVRTLDTVLKAFDSYCEPQKNETVERFKFNMRNQNDETFESFLTEIKTMAKSCNFGQLENSLIRDKIVIGIKDSNLRERLLRTKDLDLPKAEDICRAAEITKESVSTLDQAAAVHKIKESKSEKLNENAHHSNSKRECKFCGGYHEFISGKCPAYGKICGKCNGKNHFAKKCYTSKSKINKNKSVNMKFVNEHDSNEDLYVIKEETVLDQVHSIKSKGEIFATMKIGEKTVEFQLDTGCSATIVPKKFVPPKTKLRRTDKLLKMYNGTLVTPLGICSLTFQNMKNDKRYKAECTIVENEYVPIIGNILMQEMNLIKVNYENILNVRQHRLASSPLTKDDLFREYGDVFQGTGCLDGKYHLTIDPDIAPVVHPPRKVPVALKEKLKVELDNLVENKIITPVTEPTPWVSSMVIVVKPNKLRICLDPKDLNRALKRSHYPMPTLDEVLPSLSKAKVFSVLDAKNGFWHVQLDKESSLLTTFNTPFGRYRWLRMPFGISTAPEEYQRRQDQVIEGLEGVANIVDDILVFGEGDTEEEAIADHDRKLIKLLERCRERNLKLNISKLMLREKSVRWTGHLVTDKGLKPDPEKIKAVMNMPEPTDVTGVRRFIGFVNYMSKFVPGLSDLCEPLRKLTLQDSEWFWNETHSNAMNAIKKILTSEPVLKYYDPKLPLTLQVDSSDTGLGAALMQNEQPIAYASRALTPTESNNYAQIEKEMLAVVFGMEKFHQYVYGQKVLVQSDHKPLESIRKKSIIKAPKRLQKMLLRLQVYDYDLVYRPGRLMQLADTLSRAYINDTESRGNTEREIETINMASQVGLTADGISNIRRETMNDESMKVVKAMIMRGWPDKLSATPLEARPYYNVRDELSIENDVIFKGERIVIPPSLRHTIRSRAHSSHIGIEGSLRRARECVYWPNMNSEIKLDIERCETCRAHDDAQSKETLQPHEVHMRPWCKVGCDLFTYKQKEFLVIVDYYSNFIEVESLDSTSSRSVIKKLRQQFARYGIPEIVISDNGPQFSSFEFKEFARKWEFKHITSSPGYPQSNGKAEQAVKTCKRLLERVSGTGDVYLALLDFRNTPTQGIDSSPAQRLMSRRTRTLMPVKDSLLNPKVVPEYTREQLLKQKERQKRYHDRSARDLPPLRAGDAVRIAPSQGHPEWRKGVVETDLGRRSYDVKVEGGAVYRRNRRDIRSSHHTPNEQVEPMEISCDRREDNPSTEKCTDTENGRKKCTDNETGSPMEKTTSPEIRTRSGRVVVPPNRLDL